MSLPPLLLSPPQALSSESSPRLFTCELRLSFSPRSLRPDFTPCRNQQAKSRLAARKGPWPA
eukprot:1511265-Rhodomonas_salina.1